jgi:hypothetical protein
LISFEIIECKVLEFCTLYSVLYRWISVANLKGLSHEICTYVFFVSIDRSEVPGAVRLLIQFRFRVEFLDFRKHICKLYIHTYLLEKANIKGNSSKKVGFHRLTGNSRIEYLGEFSAICETALVRESRP